MYLLNAWLSTPNPTLFAEFAIFHFWNSRLIVWIYQCYSQLNLVDMMSNSLHMKIIYCRWVLFPTMIPLEKFIHQPCLAYRMINSALFCSIWLTGSMTYLFKEVQAKKITLSNYLWMTDQRPLILSLSKSFLTLHNYNMICLKHLNNAKSCMWFTRLELVSVHPEMHQWCVDENWNIIGT